MKIWGKYLLWTSIVTFWGILCFVVPDFLDNPTTTWQSALWQIGYICELYISNFGLLYIIGLSKYVAAICYPIYAILGAAVAYFRVAQCATITPMIIEATINTNASEVNSVVSWHLIAYILLNLLLVAFLLWYRFRINAPKYAWGHAIGCLLLLLGFYNSHPLIRTTINQHYPYNVAYSTSQYLKIQKLVSKERTMPYVYAKEDIDSLDIIFVIGEAMRSDHLSINGYERNTTPRLQARANIVSFPNIYSEYTWTARSVPHIVTIADSIHPEAAFTTTSFVSCLEQFGYQSAWISNQDYDRSYVTFIFEADTLIFPHFDKDVSVPVSDEWVDIDLIAPLHDCLSRGYAKNISVIHTIGSHWYYNNHVSPEFKIFQPITDNHVVVSNTIEQVVNSYDNTVCYLDYFLDSLCASLSTRKALVIYLSDHGESLGESRTFFHAGNNEESHYPACLVWYSDAYALAFPDKVNALHLNSQKEYRTDFLFYSILSAAGVAPQENRVELDIFSAAK